MEEITLEELHNLYSRNISDYIREDALHHRVQNGSGAHPASCPMGTKGSFPGVKAAGA
jgi:hypothetical protein